MIIDPSFEKSIAEAFYLWIPVCESDEQLENLISDSMQVERAVRQMLDGSISIEDLLDAVEPVIPSMDRYVEEVESNLGEAIILYQSIPAYYG